MTPEANNDEKKPPPRKAGERPAWVTNPYGRPVDEQVPEFLESAARLVRMLQMLGGGLVLLAVLGIAVAVASVSALTPLVALIVFSGVVQIVIAVLIYALAKVVETAAPLLARAARRG